MAHFGTRVTKIEVRCYSNRAIPSRAQAPVAERRRLIRELEGLDMSWRTRRIAALAASVAAVSGMLGVVASAPASVDIHLTNWAVYGSLTPKKLNEPVI